MLQWSDGMPGIVAMSIRRPSTPGGRTRCSTELHHADIQVSILLNFSHYNAKQISSTINAPSRVTYA